MSTVANISNYLVPNLFNPSTYYDLDLRDGAMATRNGVKVVTFSSFALRGVYIGLKNETGPAWALVLRRCGEIWGERFAHRFIEETSAFYGEGMDKMSMARFNALLSEYFAMTGWGRMRLEFDHIALGILTISVKNPILGSVLGEAGQRMDVLLEGVLKAVFSLATGKEMDCYETESVMQGAPVSRFIIGLESRLADVPEWLEQGMGHDEIIRKLRV